MEKVFGKEITELKFFIELTRYPTLPDPIGSTSKLLSHPTFIAFKAVPSPPRLTISVCLLVFKLEKSSIQYQLLHGVILFFLNKIKYFYNLRYLNSYLM